MACFIRLQALLSRVRATSDRRRTWHSTPLNTSAAGPRFTRHRAARVRLRHSPLRVSNIDPSSSRLARSALSGTTASSTNFPAVAVMYSARTPIPSSVSRLLSIASSPAWLSSSTFTNSLS